MPLFFSSSRSLNNRPLDDFWIIFSRRSSESLFGTLCILRTMRINVSEIERSQSDRGMRHSKRKTIVNFKLVLAHPHPHPHHPNHLLKHIDFLLFHPLVISLRSCFSFQFRCQLVHKME
ncbi:hypothetical protein H5410_024764 [Solanum commersonii]|uniref:Uncharacterized protein n=1 Tax=Solanum commersonii TaxID=4109 RepID=A0A9J5ZMX5_SOLCO|nr:hypothetical protein H5410_024764 [Solanum commersonii]